MAKITIVSPSRLVDFIYRCASQERSPVEVYATDKSDCTRVDQEVSQAGTCLSTLFLRYASQRFHRALRDDHQRAYRTREGFRTDEARSRGPMQTSGRVRQLQENSKILGKGIHRKGRHWLQPHDDANFSCRVAQDSKIIRISLKLPPSWNSPPTIHRGLCGATSESSCPVRSLLLDPTSPVDSSVNFLELGYSNPGAWSKQSYVEACSISK
jgi:hypothetical protein